jgi:hypothetical protein
MQIRQLKVSRFRGIATLDWTPGNQFCCLIGAGDAGKSSVLDAIEAVLSSRWFSFTEPDFFACDTGKPIIIECTVGELSKALKSDERFGLFIRGWTSASEIRDEPEAEDEPVLTVRLTVDATMEPIWEVTCDRTADTRTLSNRDRALFGLVRLAGEDARHLTWGQGSILSRLTGDAKEAGAVLADAYRTARASAKLDEIKSLTEAATQAEAFAKELGAYVQGTYEPGLELGRGGISSGSIALHDAGVPLRLAGLGTRRLATLAIQKSAISEGAIVLVDEIEHGLEPHRIIGAISQLKADQSTAAASGTPIGQVLLTTHSDVALSEVPAEGLRVVQTASPTRYTSICALTAPEPLRPLLRFTPRALFARRILVCEGNTELGLLLGLREFWPVRHGHKPIEQVGSALADGNGSQAPAIAQSLASLGYRVALYRDSDVALTAGETAGLVGAGIPIIEYGALLNSEQAIFQNAPDVQVQALLVHLRNEFGEDAVNDNLVNAIGDLSGSEIRADFSTWEQASLSDGSQLRQAIATVAERKRWFKNQRVARDIAPFIWQIAGASPTAPITRCILQAEGWLYA